MANREDEERMQTDENEPDRDDADSSSQDGDSDNDDESPPTEWLATGRERRSTAGNRMKSMIAAEEPDDDLELLFAEDEDDVGFTDIGDDGSDVQMDSSSDDEDAQEGADELEGEKELEKQSRESRQAARKRKAQEAIPMKFRKKVKIAPTPSGSSPASELKPRPKKKSERTSWLPSPADMPTRASKRETTMLSKEQLHQQMIEREVKRLKQVEAMEKKAKKMEALKKPPMTQAQRLAEAAVVEKKNSKSLNRWEEAEKQREEERRAKLAALNNRTLDGPVVTFWSGVGEWIDGKLKHVGKIVTIEEKPAKKKRASAAGQELVAESSSKEEPDKPKEPMPITTDKADNGESGLASTMTPGSKEGEVNKGVASTPAPQKDSIVEGEKSALPTRVQTTSDQSIQPLAAGAPSTEPIPAPKDIVSPSLASQPLSLSQPQTQVQAQEPQLPEARPPEMKPPDIRPPVTSVYTTSMFAPPQPSQLMKPPELKPPSNSFLAHPAGITQGGLSMPMIGYHSMPNTSNPSTVLAPPNTAQRHSPLSMPQAGACPPPIPAPSHLTQPLTVPTSTATIPASTRTPTPAPAHVPAPAPISAPKSAPIPPHTPAPIQTSTSTPAQKHTPTARYTSKTPLSTAKSSKANAQKHQHKEAPPPPPPSPPANGKATRNCIILQNFDENAVKEKSVQNRILFAKDMAKLSKPAPVPRCAITNHPARYRDPKTGLPYYNAYAYKEIQKLRRGEYKWSRLAGAWMGSGSLAATGVPARFLDPDAPRPPKKADVPENAKEDAPDSNKPIESALVASTVPAIPDQPREQTAATNVAPPTLDATLGQLAAPALVPTPASVSVPAPPAQTSVEVSTSTAPSTVSAPVQAPVQKPTLATALAELSKTSVGTNPMIPAAALTSIATPATPVVASTGAPAVPLSATTTTTMEAGSSRQ